MPVPRKNWRNKYARRIWSKSRYSNI
jgi:hypothetical protein